VLTDCEDQDLTDSAKDLLRECLSTEQSRPKTFHQVLKHPFLNREKLQLKKLNEGQKNIESTVKSGFNEMNVKLDRTHKMLSEMQTELANVSRGVSNILKDCHAPKLMCIIPADSSVKDWINLNALVGKKVKVIFICPVTLSIPRDDNNKPMGYSMEMPRDWVRKYGPALKISYEILRIGFAVGRFAGLPLPNLSSAGSSTNVMNVLNDNLVDYMGKDYMGEEALDLEELAGVLGDRVTLALPEADENLSKHVNKGMQKVISTSYDEVKKIAKQNGDEDFLQTGLTKVVYNGHVEYVLNKSEIKNMYEKEGPSCIGLTPAKLQTLGASDVVVKEDVGANRPCSISLTLGASDVGANVDVEVNEDIVVKEDVGAKEVVVVIEGYLHQKKRFGWKEKKAILHKSGFIIGKSKPKVVRADVLGTDNTFKLTYGDGTSQVFKSTKSRDWVEKATTSYQE